MNGNAVSTALVLLKRCIECHEPTTGSIGGAGFYWPNLCQSCKDQSDREFLSSLESQLSIFQSARRREVSTQKFDTVA